MLLTCQIPHKWKKTSILGTLCGIQTLWAPKKADRATTSSGTRGAHGSGSSDHRIPQWNSGFWVEMVAAAHIICFLFFHKHIIQAPWEKARPLHQSLTWMQRPHSDKTKAFSSNSWKLLSTKNRQIWVFSGQNMTCRKCQLFSSPSWPAWPQSEVWWPKRPCDPVWKVELGEKVAFSTVFYTFLYNNNLSLSALPKHQNTKCIR